MIVRNRGSVIAIEKFISNKMFYNLVAGCTLYPLFNPVFITDGDLGGPVVLDR